jgi:hypothetical protein
VHLLRLVNALLAFAREAVPAPGAALAQGKLVKIRFPTTDDVVMLKELAEKHDEQLHHTPAEYFVEISAAA